MFASRRTVPERNTAQFKLHLCLMKEQLTDKRQTLDSAQRGESAEEEVTHRLKKNIYINLIFPAKDWNSFFLTPFNLNCCVNNC